MNECQNKCREFSYARFTNHPNDYLKEKYCIHCRYSTSISTIFIRCRCCGSLYREKARHSGK